MRQSVTYQYFWLTAREIVPVDSPTVSHFVEANQATSEGRGLRRSGKILTDFCLFVLYIHKSIIIQLH